MFSEWEGLYQPLVGLFSGESVAGVVFALGDFEAAGVYAFVCLRLTVFLLFSHGAWNLR